MPDTLPADPTMQPEHFHGVIVEATYKDPKTGALYVHRDLVAAEPAWADESHVGPPKTDERFGDVESWASYVKRFGGAAPFESLATWNSAGLRAVLDYHEDATSGGRMQWTAAMPFERSPEWKAWLALCDGQPRTQRRAIESLEDLGADITDPVPAELMNLLRNLRATVNATAQTELLPDGTTRVGFSQDKAVKGIGNDVSLPPEFTITVPILKGHDVRYRLVVKLRASIDDSAHLTFRFSIPLAERALEAVYSAVVAQARTELGESFALLRASG